MKKRVWIGISAVVCLAGVIFAASLFDENYTDVIERNWDMKFLGKYVTEYEMQDEQSIFGLINIK